MKIIKGLGIFLIISIIFGGCVNPPESSIIPQITVDKVRYNPSSNTNAPDTIFIDLSFKDGDGDLGYDRDNLTFLSTPYNEKNFYIEKNGSLMPVGTTTQILLVNNKTRILPRIIDVPAGETGLLVTKRTKKKPGYEDKVPAFVFPFTCTELVFDSVCIRAKDKQIFDNSFIFTFDNDDNIDTIFNGNQPEYYILRDTFYFQFNPNHYNIEVKFLVDKRDANGKSIKDTDGNLIFEEFDWQAASGNGSCFSNFNRRFPVLSQTDKQLEGTLSYAMTSTQFRDYLSDRIIKFQVQIKDRALHVSNSAFSEPKSFDELDDE